MALVSVVIPTRNRIQHLPGAIRTVLDQSERDIEVIIVDDGSSDGTPVYLRGLSAREPRVRVVRNDISLGAGGARSQGVQLASAPFIAFNDDDCGWNPEKLRLMLDRFRQSPDLGVVFSPIQLKLPSGETVTVGATPPSSPEWRYHLFRHGTVGPQGLMIRREVFLGVGGFDATLPRIEDWDLWLRLHAAGVRVGFVPLPLVETDLLEGGISTQSDAFLRAVRLLDTKYEDIQAFTKAELAWLYHGWGHELLVNGDQAAGREYLRRACIASPARVKPWLALLLASLSTAAYKALLRG